MVSNDCFIKLTINYFYILFILDLLVKSYNNISSNILQFLFSGHILLIFDLFVSYLLYQHTLILKLVLGCDIKLLVVRIPKFPYVFASPAGLWKVVDSVLVFVIAPVAINTLI